MTAEERITALEARLAGLEARLAALEARTPVVTYVQAPPLTVPAGPLLPVWPVQPTTGTPFPLPPQNTCGS